MSPLAVSQRALRTTIRLRAADAFVSATSENHLQVSDTVAPSRRACCRCSPSNDRCRWASSMAARERSHWQERATRPLWCIRAERNPVAGVRNLKVPLPPPETARRLADALSVLADALRGNGW